MNEKQKEKAEILFNQLRTSCSYHNYWESIESIISAKSVESVLLAGEKREFDDLQHFRDSSIGLYCIDKNPNDVDIEWIRKNAFQLSADSPSNGRLRASEYISRLTAYEKWLVGNNNRDLDMTARQLWADLQNKNNSAFTTMTLRSDETNFEKIDAKLVAAKLIVIELEDLIRDEEKKHDTDR